MSNNTTNKFEQYQTADTVSYRKNLIRKNLTTIAYYVDEEFKEHPKYNRYLIGSKGTIYDTLLQRKLPHKDEGGTKNNHYESVYIKENNSNAFVHRLILETFDPNPQSDHLCVNHINSNRRYNEWNSDPNKNNLEWCTPKENTQHAVKNGRMKCAEDHPRSIFTNEEVHQICQMMSDGKSSEQIAKELNLELSPQISKNLSDIRNGRNYTSISSQYQNLHVYSGNHIRVNDDMVREICNLLVQGKTAPEIASILEIPYGDGSKMRSLIQSLKAGLSHRNITQNYTFSYRDGAKGYRDR